MRRFGLICLLCLMISPLVAQDSLNVVGMWGTAQQQADGQQWALIRFNADSTFASIMIYVDTEGMHPVAGWPAAVEGRFTITTIMGDRVICLQRNAKQAEGIINGAPFRGAHCAPIYARTEGVHEILEWSGLTVVKLTDAEADLKQSIADS